MKIKLPICLILTALLTACVQKTYTKTVVYTLHLTGPKSAQTVGIRGNDKPLNWQSDVAMKRSRTDSLTYRAVVTYQTGYLFTEAKFVVNDKFELADQPNRRVVFSKIDTTFYETTFGELNPDKTN